jgi:5-oxoprolinase (ATP-hydrolysing)
MDIVPSSGDKWRFAVDTGGTFTDVIGLAPDGSFRILKLLSKSPLYGEASLEGIRRVLGLDSSDSLPWDSIDGIRFGTTVATNAFLERKGSKVGLIVTRGFRDLLEIGHQSRPDIFSLCIEKPPVLYSHVIEAGERIGPDGRVEMELDAKALESDILKLAETGIESVAVVLMHSWKNPRHELLAKDLLKRHGIRKVFVSHQAMNHIKIVGRGQCCLINAYLSKTIDNYVEGITSETGPIRIQFMKSSGALSSPDNFKGHEALLSGPAGGVVAVASVARSLGLKSAVGFDMGGTSTDVSRFEGAFEMSHEKTVAGIEFQTESMNITTIASGGGSILWHDGERMRVGPESAGADPGPASYGFGGPLTVTDVNVLTGRIIPEHFPRTFGPKRDSPLDKDIAEKKFEKLSRQVPSSESNIGSLALGFLRVVNEQMAMAIKEISVSKGFDVREYALVCFGGAGGQHACQVASILNMKHIVFHPLGGLLSAYGIGLANPSRNEDKTVLKPYNKKTHEELRSLFEEMAEKARSLKTARLTKELDLRPKGADTFLTVSYNDEDSGYKETESRFKEKYIQRFGFYPEGVPLEVVNLRLRIIEEETFLKSFSREAEGNDKPVSVQKILYPWGHEDVPVYEAHSLSVEKEHMGPLIIIDNYSTFVVDPGFSASAQKDGTIIVQRVSEREDGPYESRTEPDPVLLEVFQNTFRSISTEMGHTLRNTAHSVNIKERLDFSCAVFDGNGELVANAPHMPVHLGSMADTVKEVIRGRLGDMRPGDMYLTNDPYRGGSHLPDMTVICPVFSDNGELTFFTAARGHHADVGGTTPGSMPPHASHIEEEGILIRNLLLIRNGKFMEKELMDVLKSHRYPARNPGEQIQDLKAQVAACNTGVEEIHRVVVRYGLTTVKKYMAHIKRNAENAVKRALMQFLQSEEEFISSFEDCLDDGTPVAVSITIHAGEAPPATTSAIIDFTGTGSEHKDDNLNAPLPVTRSAVLYVLRAITGEDIPLNSGCLRPVEIRVPEGSLLNPAYPCAVASGNVETSQRVVDVLLGALGVASASQGTMNNLLFEVKGETPYYETIAGGAGAMDDCPGASGVQVHMTNTRITDPEVLEQRHPGVRLRRFTLRRGSGGEGRYRGGDGVTREIEFLKPTRVSIISERRKTAPYGINGGGSGLKGLNIHKQQQGKTVELDHRVSLNLKKGEAIVIETPGGGGWGTV